MVNISLHSLSTYASPEHISGGFLFWVGSRGKPDEHPYHKKIRIPLWTGEILHHPTTSVLDSTIRFQSGATWTSLIGRTASLPPRARRWASARCCGAACCAWTSWRPPPRSAVAAGAASPGAGRWRGCGPWRGAPKVGKWGALSPSSNGVPQKVGLRGWGGSWEAGKALPGTGIQFSHPSGG